MKSAKEAGFTVVELLLGIILFGILIPAIIISLNTVGAANDYAKDLTIANIVAENKIEELRSIGFNSVNTGSTDFSSSLPATLGGPKAASVTVTNNTPGIKDITVTISFTSRKGTKVLTYKSLLGELGVGQ